MFGYVGACLSFIAPAVQHANVPSSTTTLRIVLVCATILTVIGTGLAHSTDLSE